MDYFNNSFAGSLNNKINVAVRSVGSILYNLKEIVCNIIILLCIPLFYAKINVYIGLAFFFGFIIYLFALINIRKKFVDNEKELSEMVSKYFGLINDDFLNISNIKIFSNQIFERRNVKRQNIEIMRKEYKLTKIQILFHSINFLCNFLLFFSTLGIAGYLLANSQILIADFTYIVIITSISRWLIIGGLKALTIVYSSIGDLQNALDTIYKPISIKNKNNSKKLISSEGKIVFKNVRFDYEK